MRMRLFSNRSSLQRRLTFYPLFWFFIGLVVTFIATATTIKIYLDNYLVTQIQAYARQISRDVTSLIERDRQTVFAFLLSDSIREMRDPAKMEVLLERLLSQNKNFLEGFVVNPKGQCIIAASRLRIFSDNRPDFQEQPIFQEAKGGQTAVSGWENFSERKRPYWYMAVPIRKYPGDISGVFIVTIDLSRIEDVILTSEGAKYGNAILLDHNANVLVHLDWSKLGNNLGNLGAAQKAIRGEIGTVAYTNNEGQYVIAAYQPLNPYGWGLIVEVPPGQTVYIIRNKVILLFGFMTVFMFVVTGVMLYWAARKIVRPIRELTLATRLFGRDQKVEYQHIAGKDELAQLSEAFAEMANSIKDFEKNRAQYIAMIAHDLRSPIASMKELFKTIQHDHSNPEQKEQNVKGLNHRMEQVQRMINDLLEFSRLDMGQLTFYPEIVSVRNAIEDVISGYPTMRQKFVMKSFAEEICVWADPLRFQQIIGNIVDNSIKHTAPETKVVFDCQTDSEQVKIIVADNGNGINPDILENLFKPFHSSSKQKGSFGLGLAIAKKLAQEMKGDLKVSSKVNEGTTFMITFSRFHLV